MRSLTVAVFALNFVLCWAVTDAEPSVIPRRPKYEYFDDYLISITAGAPASHNQVLDKEDEGQSHPRDPHVQENPSDDTADSADATPTDTPNSEASVTDIIGYFRDVPRQHWSCCMLGKLAGDKGFHCDANFYATRITRRNRNRAHNRRMLFQGRDNIPQWGMEIMHTFERCIARHAAEFHKCCYAGNIERREIERWHYYRHATSDVSTLHQHSSASDHE